MLQRLKAVEWLNSAPVSVVAVVRWNIDDAHVSYKRLKRKNETNQKSRTGSPQPRQWAPAKQLLRSSACRVQSMVQDGSQRQQYELSGCSPHHLPPFRKVLEPLWMRAKRFTDFLICKLSSPRHVNNSWVSNYNGGGGGVTPAIFLLRGGLASWSPEPRDWPPSGPKNGSREAREEAARRMWEVILKSMRDSSRSPVQEPTSMMKKCQPGRRSKLFSHMLTHNWFF